MAIYRPPPGSPAPTSGTYALVDHFGEPTGFTIWCDQGDPLPLKAVTDGVAPHWYVLVAYTSLDAKAA